jgi:aromatic-amino-acid transaminase
MHAIIPAHRHRPGDQIFSLNREATQRRARGETIVNATLGALADDAGKLAILPTAARVVSEVEAGDWAAYAPIAGVPELLEGVLDDVFAESAELRGTAIASATLGGSGAIRHAIANFLEPGQALLTSSFYWGPYHTMADENGCRLETFSMFRSEGGGLDIESLDRAIAAQHAAQGRVLLIINDPCQNPTGYTLQDSEWAGVIDTVAAHAASGPVTLLVDTAYAAFAASTQRSPIPRLAPLLGRAQVLIAWTASKTFTHYGLRVGTLIGCGATPEERSELQAAFAYSSRGTWSNGNRGGQTAIARLLREPELAAACNREREELRALLSRRAADFNRLATARGIGFPRYEGGFFVTVFHPDPMARAAALRERGVYVVPMDSPGATGLRVGLCGVPTREIPMLVDVLAS